MPDSDDKYNDIMEAVALIGKHSRWYQRRLARQCGLTVLPGHTINIVHNGRAEKITREDEDLNIWEEGELEYNASQDRIIRDV